MTSARIPRADEDARVVVVGASLAGLRGAESLRLAGHRGPLTIVGDEPHLPYDRPPLSKHVIAGEMAPDATTLPHRLDLDAAWRLGAGAAGLDRQARTIVLSDGERLPYDRLLIATGARARPWHDEAEGTLEGVFTLRGRDDAAALRAALAAAPKRVLIVGGGFIGCEVASVCRDLGLPVTLVDPLPAPLAKVLGLAVSGFLRDWIAAAGVEVRSNTGLRSLDGRDGRVVGATLDDGSTIAADVVVVALGAVPNTGWLEGSGLALESGALVCDGHARVRAQDGGLHPEIRAAGDVALWPHPLYDGRMVRLEHWGNAVAQGEYAGRALALGDGDRPAFAGMPEFWSNQFGITIKLAGLTEGADSLAVVQGSLKDRRFLAVYGRAGRTVAALSVDCARWLPAYAEAIAARAPFPPIANALDQPSRLGTLDPSWPTPPPEVSARG
ncbi:FAD/NAD(P)-binding oxidoreductase [Methylobacterium sp. Leaf466]|uniref:NAD(P)/FAD-dependent oxidoreductase n=1 Tax=Methylobacterium sp. Leaf466 TaxID=1736386 RepID=UPI0006FEE20B|nr:FAD/NAD(P)-binding oxidoreductase [Methylobacterium sp. Leaf466]KQT89009.1 ferredoxin reductase [Methylobacterium sp. Leaf466]